MTAGVKLVENLASFTDAYGTNKNFKKRDKTLRENVDPFAGSLSRDKHYFRDPKSGSAQWKGLLDDGNPDVSTNDFYQSARSFITPDEKGFKPADDAYTRWEGFAFNDFGPGNKEGELADRIDTEDIQSFYDTYTSSRLVSDEDYRSSANLRYMFEEPAAIGNTEANPNEAGVSPSKGITV